LRTYFERTRTNTGFKIRGFEIRTAEGGPRRGLRGHPTPENVLSEALGKGISGILRYVSFFKKISEV